MFLMTPSWRLMALPALVALAVLVIAACGDDDEGGDNGSIVTSGPTEAATDVPEGNGGVASDSLDVTIAGFAFSPSEYRVPAGERVTFNITNSDGVTHNMHIASNVAAEGEAVAGDYTGSRCDGAADPCSDPPTISGGGSAVLEWTVPDESGAVQFRCDFHPTSMTGQIVIE